MAFSRLVPATLLVATASVSLVGCGNNEFPTSRCGGSVTIDGVPFTTGQVMFTPVAKPGETLAGPAAIGVLDPEGRFVLGAYGDDDGAVVGPNWVTIINTADGGSSPKFDRIKLPSGTFDVVAGDENQFAIELTKDMIRKYARR